jgi:flagellar basal body rod protein FlgF
MKTSNSTLTAAEIRNLNLNEKDIMGFDFQWENSVDNNYITINGDRVVSFTKQSDRKKSFDKIKRMGLALGWQASQLTDEEEGIIQAHKNGENPFAYSIICANPDMNEVVK